MYRGRRLRGRGAPSVLYLKLTHVFSDRIARMTIILGIDTATHGCSAALVDGEGRCLGVRAAEMARGQSEALAPMMQAVLNKAGIDFSVLAAVAVTRGPGAFTGLRIGLAAARASALAAGIPCLGITTFDVLMRQAKPFVPNGAATLIAIETKREDVYVQVFDQNGEALRDAAAMSPDAVPAWLGALEHVCLAGDAAPRLAAVMGVCVDAPLLAATVLPNAESVAALGFDVLDVPETASPDPIYLRAPDVTMPGT